MEIMDYRSWLKGELEKRIQAKPRYSLRAFARDLRMKPQVLSLVLSGKRGLSLDSAAQVAERLRLADHEAVRFLDWVAHDLARTPSAKRLLAYRIRSLGEESGNEAYQLMQEDLFRSFSDWYHPAILELTQTEGFGAQPGKIARRLGISRVEAQEAVSRLLRLGLLVEEDGKLKKRHSKLTTTQDVPSQALRELTKKLLERASEAIDEQDVQDRDFGTYTMAIDPERLPEAKAMIRQFRRRLARFLEQGRRREVYLFSSQLFRLTQSQVQAGKDEV